MAKALSLALKGAVPDFEGFGADPDLPESEDFLDPNMVKEQRLRRTKTQNAFVGMFRRRS